MKERSKSVVTSNGVATQNRGDVDLTHVKFSTPSKPSRNSEIIHQFAVLTSYLYHGHKKEDFLAANEREIVEKFLQLDEIEQQKVYTQLKHDFSSLK